MRIEYSNVGGAGPQQYAYHFIDSEKKLLITGLKYYLKKLEKDNEKKIKAVEEHPENEGQGYFRDQIRDLISDVEFVKEVIKEFEEELGRLKQACQRNKKHITYEPL